MRTKKENGGSHPGQTSTNGPLSYLETFAAIIRDHRLSHGAFRLWHALRDYTDHTSQCFPGQRRLAVDIGCNIHSLKRWTEELVAAGWLKIAKGKSGDGFTYTVMGGTGQPLRKAATPTVAENGHPAVAEKRSGGVAESGNDPLRKVATKVSSPMNQAHLSESAHARLAEIPGWAEFWGYCQTQACLLPAEWYARDKWEAANSENWRRMTNWQAYARRCKGWWEADGRPMSPPARGRNGKAQLRPDHGQGF